jgi:cytochrome bd-type quinol oxidase subunit 1
MADDEQSRPPRAPLQFSLRSLMGLMLAVALLFGTLRWLNVSPTASAVVLAVLILGALAAVGLLAVIAGGSDDER